MLSFDAETLKLLDVSYKGAEITRRRAVNMAALAPAPGERLLDLGCGQGLMTEEIARAVGPTGEVIGVDPSEDMLAGAQARCADHANVTIIKGGADAIPVDDGSLDGVVSLQVMEYVKALSAAVAEIHRKLRPGGRVVIGDMQWGTLSLASDNLDRMTRMQAAWERHVTELDTPGVLPHLLTSHGFHLTEMRPIPFTAHQLRPDSLPFMLMHLMRGYAIENDLMPEAEALAWFDEQEARAREGRFFFSLTHFIAIAFKR